MFSVVTIREICIFFKLILIFWDFLTENNYRGNYRRFFIYLPNSNKSFSLVARMDNTPKIHTIKPYTKYTLDSCLEFIKSGQMTCYAASKRFGIPIGTLKYRLSGRWKKCTTSGPGTVLSPAEEQDIADWLMDMQSRGFLMTRAECVSKVSHYLVSAGRETAFKNAQPGELN